ncbi:uncharacterized protein LOC129919194 [Episyrphus balteatus]|uniref:uncharacterized protein LOC129919194 n=1 Tax=Episyrphus balteatus TaxID=286459 RepID=UPI002485E5D5|nr:uncharacterized protein LOC129919194 [Episyrphus balteatus]
MKKDINVILKEQKIINDFMNERDLPDWFRGLSTFQREAADSLLNCIRDDCEQATSHRVRDALRRIGIEPPVDPSKIKFVMQLSRGNDMAFLWFLMELYYRNSSQVGGHNKKYSVNEQIFITVIAYLDTIPTLRELDKLLPKKAEEIKTKKTLKKKVIKSVVTFPYFQKQPRPILYGKSLTMNEIDNKANFSEYEKYRNPNYIVPNEASRWFANYKLRKIERIANGIIKEQIDTIFNQELDKNEEQESLTVCVHHQNMQKLKESIANELKVLKRKECEKYFDINGHFKNKSLKRVMNELNSEITKAAENVTQFANKNLRTTADKEVPHKIQEENLNLYDFGHDAVLNTKCNYFEAPTTNKPYKFNYNKIFDLGAKNPVKDAIAFVLNAESSENVSIENSRAIRKCCKKIWAEEVKNYNSNYKKEQKSKEKESPQLQQDVFELNQGNFDPRDTKLMQSLLLKALQEIKKNKKFVLASLPDAHKFPILKEWIRKRYGMVYTRQEKIKTFKRTKKVFQVLRNNALRVRIPHLDDLSRKRLVSYGCKDYLLKKTNFLKDIYQDNFKESLLEDSRIYWAAVRPYQCSKGPPRNVFFAYLPARKNDVHMFRPWKVREYIHAKDEWDRRQRKQKMEFSY